MPHIHIFMQAAQNWLPRYVTYRVSTCRNTMGVSVILVRSVNTVTKSVFKISQKVKTTEKNTDSVAPKTRGNMTPTSHLLQQLHMMWGLHGYNVFEDLFCFFLQLDELMCLIVSVLFVLPVIIFFVFIVFFDCLLFHCIFSYPRDKVSVYDAR